MEEIDISQLLGYLKSKIIYIILAMAVAFCLSSIYVNRFRVPEYTSYTTILLNKSDETISSSDVSLYKSLITTYGEIIKSKRVLRTVIDNLSLDMEYSELYDEISVEEITDTNIIKISVTDESAAKAANIANETASVFSDEIVKIYNIENISIIDSAEVSLSASSTSTIKIIGVSTIAGAFLSIVVIFILFYFDTTVKKEEDIERITGLPVIGVVPISREKIKASAHRKYYENQAKKHAHQEILPVEREVRRIDPSKFEMSKVSETTISNAIEKQEEITKVDEPKQENITPVTEVKSEEKNEEVIEDKEESTNINDVDDETISMIDEIRETIKNEVEENVREEIKENVKKEVKNDVKSENSLKVESSKKKRKYYSSKKNNKNYKNRV